MPRLDGGEHGTGMGKGKGNFEKTGRNYSAARGFGLYGELNLSCYDDENPFPVPPKARVPSCAVRGSSR
jgi:hypothetical protein